MEKQKVFVCMSFTHLICHKKAYIKQLRDYLLWNNVNFPRGDQKQKTFLLLPFNAATETFPPF